MAFLKQLFGSSSNRSALKKAEAKYADATSKYADTMLDLDIDLMKVYDPALRKDDLDVKYLHSLVLGAIVARQHLDDSKVFGLGAAGLANKAWQTRFVGLRILEGLAIELATRKAPESASSTFSHNRIPLEGVVEKINSALKDPDQRIQDAAKTAIGTIDTSKRFLAPK